MIVGFERKELEEQRERLIQETRFVCLFVGRFLCVHGEHSDELCCMALLLIKPILPRNNMNYLKKNQGAHELLQISGNFEQVPVRISERLLHVDVLNTFLKNLSMNLLRTQKVFIGYMSSKPNRNYKFSIFKN